VSFALILKCLPIADFNLPGYAFAVAATKLGFLSKPIWCFTNQPFDGTWFSSDQVTPNTDDARYNILVKFTSPHGAYLTVGDVQDTVACESL